MKATGLRVGNWIHNNVESTQITKNDLIFLLNGDNEHFAEPIQLTNSWFEKFGFDGSEYFYLHQKMYGIYFRKPYVEAKHYLVKSNGQDSITTLNYVHQLQNLYFALTGEELTIKGEK